MENKYYIPNIKEFHEGFKYEVLCNVNEVSTDDIAYYLEWSKETFYLNESHTKLIKYVNLQKTLNKDGDIRVKYLDMEDIEDSGFTYIFIESLPTLTHIFKKVGINEDNSDVYLIHYVESNIVVITENILKYTQRKSFFEGVIKNKSELRKLFIQLGVLKG